MAEHGHEHAEHEMHTSIWPFVVCMGLMVLYFGFAFIERSAGMPLLVLGALGTSAGLAGWVVEDTKVWASLKRWRIRPEPGKDYGWWGLMFFLGTEVMIFGAIFATWFNGRASADVWPPAASPGLPILGTGINTIILLLSGATMHWAHMAIRKNNRKHFHLGLVLTLILGAIFLGGQVFEYRELYHEGLTLKLGPYGASFYMLTGTHGVHVFGGLVFIAIVLYRGLKGQFDEERHVAVEASAIYWHFVDVVWVFLYAVVYLAWL